MNIVLFQPQIPQNTGNIARTCAVTGTTLVLIRPLGFKISDRFVQRAGLDYWGDVSLKVFDSLDDYLNETALPFYFFSSHGKTIYTDADFSQECSLIFGSETEGIPKKYWEKYTENFVTLPMCEKSRCLNLATSAGIGLYEALRQQNYRSLKVR